MNALRVFRSVNVLRSTHICRLHKSYSGRPTPQPAYEIDNTIVYRYLGNEPLQFGKSLNLKKSQIETSQTIEDCIADFKTEYKDSKINIVMAHDCVQMIAMKDNKIYCQECRSSNGKVTVLKYESNK